jgi:hypothetical protein
MPITLPHTGLQIPHDRLRIDKLDTHETARGIAFTAQLIYHGQLAGLISNDGHGDTEYRPTADSRFAGTDLERFAQACRTVSGPAPDTETVLDLLVEEHETNRLLARARRRGKTLACHVHHDDPSEAIPGLETSVCDIREIPPGQEHTDRAERAHLITRLNRQLDCDGDGTWQVWTGTTWAPLAA